jgi:precorrin-6B methylase 2
VGSQNTSLGATLTVSAKLPPFEYSPSLHTDKQMNTVFIGGSRDISRLPEEAKKRLENIIASKHRIIVGDAKGTDTAIQKLLHANSDT